MRCIPGESQYAEAIRDTVGWFREDPGDWEATWRRIDEKYQRNPAYRRFSCAGAGAAFNIDAKLNGAYIVMGLLYGGGDPERTIRIAMRCGQDSDCNPSSAAGILFAARGLGRLPGRFTSALDRHRVFSHTGYDFDRLLAVSESLAREAVRRAGGRIETGADGAEVLVIPADRPRPNAGECCWAPGPTSGSRYTDAELAQIQVAGARQRWQRDLDRRFPGWTLRQCGPDMDPGLRAEYQGRRDVFMSHPLDRDTPCTLSREVVVPAEGRTVLSLAVARDLRGDFTLEVKAAGEVILSDRVGPHPDGPLWHAFAVDLSRFAGRTIPVELINRPDGWSYEAAYWGGIDVRTGPDPAAVDSPLPSAAVNPAR